MAPGAVRSFARDESFTYQMVGGIVPRDEMVVIPPVNLRAVQVLALLTVIVIAMTVFGGFYLFADGSHQPG